MVDFPKVLYVGVEPIGSPTNTGLTLGTMYGSWPPAALLQVCLGPGPGAPDVGHTYIAPPAVLPFSWLLRSTLGSQWRQRRLSARGTDPAESDGMNNSVSSTSTKTVRQHARIALTALNDLAPVVTTPALRREVRLFQPQVIHSLLGGVQMMRLSLALSRHLDVPIVPHFMDDWVATLFTNGQLAGLARVETERVFAQVMGRSPLCLTIGRDMQREFEERLQRPCQIVGNSVDPVDYDVDEYRKCDPGEHLTMRYVGGLHLGRHEVLERLAQAAEVQPFAGREWRIELFVPDHDRRRAQRIAERFPCVFYGGNLSPEEVSTSLVRADALLFLESEEPGVSDFTRLSVSTKVPQYLAAQRPILLTGPPGQGSINTLLRSPTSVYTGPAPTPERLRACLDEVTAMVLHPVDRSTHELPEWFIEEFGHATTQDRLRTTLAVATRATMKLDVRDEASVP